jgi:hypothetical protein
MQPSSDAHGLFQNKIKQIVRPLRPDIVHFHLACLGSEIFLRELTHSSTLISNPKSSRRPAVISQIAILYSLIHDILFRCSTTRIDDDTRLCH